VTDETVTQGDSDRTLSHTTFRYDSLCRLTEAKNADATVTYEYDDAGRMTAETAGERRTGTTASGIMSRSAPPQAYRLNLP